MRIWKWKISRRKLFKIALFVFSLFVVATTVLSIAFPRGLSY
jgi:hypothetical protein